MTKEQYKRAGEIKFDIKALKDQPLSCGVSDSTRECWKKWVDDTIAKLEKEKKIFVLRPSQLRKRI